MKFRTALTGNRSRVLVRAMAPLRAGEKAAFLHQSSAHGRTRAGRAKIALEDNRGAVVRVTDAGRQLAAEARAH